MNVLLIQGGWSTEREVSLASGKAVHDALLRLKHTVTLFDPKDNLDALPQAVQGQDCAFIALHGAPGEDGLIQAMLERLQIPYQGADATSSLLALDKNASKAMFRVVGIPTALSVLLPEKPPKGWLPSFDFPIFIKANTGGSSVNMERVNKAQDLDATLNRLFALESSYIVEQALTGTELTCAVLCDVNTGKEQPKALPPILIRSKSEHGIFDYANKYTKGMAEEICPAPISPELTQKIQKYALQAHNILGLGNYSRSDFILLATGEMFILETNTLPGLTTTSLLPQAAAASGLNFDQLIERLLSLSMGKKKGTA